MNEEQLRHAWLEEVGPISAPPWNPEAVSARIRRRQRTRRKLLTTTALVPLVALAVTGARFFGVGSVHREAPVVPAVPPAASTPAGPPVRVVAVGERLQIGNGIWMELKDNTLCMNVPDAAAPWIDLYCQSTAVQGDGPVVEGFTLSRRWLSVSIFRGPAARITLESGGRTYEMKLVALAGHPGWVTGYSWAARAPIAPADQRATVYDAAGNVIAPR